MTSSNSGLKLEVHQVGPAAVMTLCGSAAMDEAAQLQARLEELTSRKTPRIVLDLRQMDFISSEALGAVILAHLRTRRYEGEVRLVRPQPAVRSLLETTRLTQLFPIYDSVDQAIAGI